MLNICLSLQMMSVSYQYPDKMPKTDTDIRRLTQMNGMISTYSSWSNFTCGYGYADADHAKHK